jgi:hypothetical protein
MKFFILFAVLFLTSSFALDSNASIQMTTEDENATQLLQQQAQKAKEIREKKLASYLQELQEIEQQISQENMWMKSYASYLTSLDVRNSLQEIKKRIDYLTKHAKSINEEDELNALISKKVILTSQIEKLKGKNRAPFTKLLTPPVIDDIPSVSNPFEIFTGLSLIKTLNAGFDEYKRRRDSLESLIGLFELESKLYDKIAEVDLEGKYTTEALSKKKELARFKTALDTINATSDVYQKRLEIIELNINKAIEKQIYGVMKIGVIVLVVFIVFFLLKLIVKKYITDNERFYMANKIITLRILP